jgi:zinc protease
LIEPGAVISPHSSAVPFTHTGNRAMKIAPLIGLLSLALISASTVFAAEKDAATVDAILKKYVTAIGGKDAFDKVESRHIKADLEFGGSTAEWTSEAKAPNKRATRVDLPGIGLFEDGFDGTTAWTKSQAGVQTKQGDELALAKLDAELRRDVRFKELYPNLESKGTEMFNGEQVEVLEAKPTATSRARFSFSAKTGLLVRQQADYKNNDGNPITVETEFSDHRAVEGIKYPHAQKVSVLADGQPLFDFTLKLKEIKHNSKIDDSMFKKPE